MEKARIANLQRKMKGADLKAIVLIDRANIDYFLGVGEGLLIIKQHSAKLYPPREQLHFDYPVGFVEASLSYLQYKRLRKMGPLKATHLVDEVRQIKSKSEVAKLKKSGALLSKGMAHICEWIEPGMSELDVVDEMERFGKAHGASGFSFSPIVASGKGSAQPHYRPTKKKITKNCAIKLDFGYVVDGYCSDMTRVHFLGKPHAKMKEMYQRVVDASHLVYEACRPGVTLASLTKVATDHLDEYAPYFTHGLGHGIGIEVHEPPSFYKKGRIEEGMVLALEPGIYIPDFGGVRYENMVLVKKNGLKLLTS